jgi:hypothetical protein
MDTRKHGISSVVVNGEQWVEVEAAALASAGPHDGVYSLDRQEGTVRFGDGAHGRQPPAGASITATYRHGRGKDGNCLTAISITSTWPLTTHKYVVGVNKQGFQVRFIGSAIEQPSGEMRPSYFYGQLLTESDFSDEQNYLLGRHRRHNKFLHRHGVAQGFELQGKEDSVVISPGYAIDCCGRELILNEAIEVKIQDLESPLYVTIEHTEKETHDVPALDGSSISASRIEDCVLAYVVSEPEQRDALTIGRLVLGTSGWQVDTTFKPPRSV